jgi:DNA-directed RNA polymerase subunit RPC12/RpoP
MILFNIKEIPVELINKIVDEYVDNRYRCSKCNYKFLNLEQDLDNKRTYCCYYCSKYFCHPIINNNCSTNRYFEDLPYICIDCDTIKQKMII